MMKEFLLKGFLLPMVCSVAAVCNLSAQDAARMKSDTLQMITVTSSQRDRDLRSAAPRYTLSSRDFDTFGVTDISDALHRLPGITLRDYGGAGGMKTVSVRGLGAGHTAVVYDGVALSDCQSGQIDLSRYSLDNVAALSLIVGDADNIFQPARNLASAAAMVIETPQPEKDAATVLMRLGSWGYTNPFLSVTKRLGKKWALTAMGEYLYVKNDYPFTLKNGRTSVTYDRENNMMKSGHGEMNLSYTRNAESNMTLKAYFYDNSRGLPGMARYYVNENMEHQHDRNIFVQLQGRERLSKRFSMKYAGKFNYAMTEYEDPFYAGNIKDHQYWQREWYATAAVLYEVNRYLSLDYSADYFYNNLTGSDESDYGDPLRHTVLQALSGRFATGRFTAIGRLLHSLYINKVKSGRAAGNISHLSPSISLSYHLLPRERLFLRASFKDIFRSPSFNELYYFHYGSPTLNPERTNQFNLGATWSRDYALSESTRGSSFSVSLDAYIANVKDKIVAVPYNMFVWTNINVGKVRTVGMDFTANVMQRLSERHALLFAGSYTLQKVRDRTPESPSYNLQLPYTPEHTGSVALTWENPWVNLAVHDVMVSSRWPNIRHYKDTILKGYNEMGITLSRDFSWKKVRCSLRFDIKNLLNEQYSIVAFYPMPGRAWMVTAKANL